MTTYADELRALAAASEPDAADILRGAADALDVARNAMLGAHAMATAAPRASRKTIEDAGRIHAENLAAAIAACSLPEPQTVRGFWRTLPDHVRVTRDAVALATGRPLVFLDALEAGVLYCGGESEICAPSTPGGQWFEFVREVQP